MSEAVHVFIATTDGLVAIKGIQHRTTASLASFISIAGGSKVASITPDYRHFVKQDTSPIPGYFEFESYHMVIERDINQGQSWQLGAAIAHLLYRYDKLGNGDIEPGDEIIIASGAIESRGAKVSMITQLGQKCLSAQKQIIAWQKAHCQLSFFVPEDNYKQPLPDIPFVLSPLASISELEQEFIERGLIPQHVQIEAASGQSVSALTQSALVLQKMGSRLVNRTKLPSVDFAFLNSFKTPDITSKTEAKKWILLFGLIASLSILLYVAYSFAHRWFQEPSIVYQYELSNFDSCELTESFGVSFPDTLYSEFKPLPLEKVCSLQIGFEYLEAVPKTLWLVTDSYLRIDLLQSGTGESENWTIPLPSWKQESRTFTVMAFENELDASDAQSLDDYLYQQFQQSHPQSLKQVERPLSIEVLKQWADKQDLKVRFFQQRLQI